MDELYRNFPVRDQDTDLPRTLDLLQAWGAPARDPLRVRLSRRMRRVARWLYADRCGGRSQHAVPS